MRAWVGLVAAALCLAVSGPIAAQETVWRDPAGVLAIDLSPSGAVLSGAPRVSAESPIATFLLDPANPDARCFVRAEPDVFSDGELPQNGFRQRRLFHDQRASWRADRTPRFVETLVQALNGPRVSADAIAYTYPRPAAVYAMELRISVLHEPAVSLFTVTCVVPLYESGAAWERARAFLAGVRATPPAGDPPAPVGLAVPPAEAAAPDANGIWTAPGGAFTLDLAGSGFVVAPTPDEREYPTLFVATHGAPLVECALNVGLREGAQPREALYAEVRARPAERGEANGGAVEETPAGVPVFYLPRDGMALGSWRHAWLAEWWVAGEHIAGGQAAWANLSCTSALEDATAGQTRVDALVMSMGVPAAHN